MMILTLDGALVDDSISVPHLYRENPAEVAVDPDVSLHGPDEAVCTSEVANAALEKPRHDARGGRVFMYSYQSGPYFSAQRLSTANCRGTRRST
ncbi:MAG: hypothetical protein ACI9KE_003499 [Polyangiales bacterium]|jgi:hypothetical protein